MTQTPPNYPFMTSVSNPEIYGTLERRYGARNVVWPVVWLAGDDVQFYTYETIDISQVNGEHDNRPKSRGGLRSYYLDYVSTPRRVVPYNSMLAPAIGGEFKCSYDYILASSAYSTVDIDYAWYRNDGWYGIELTTFWKTFSNEATARDLISKMRRRPSWRGRSGAHAMHTTIETAADLGLDYYLVGVNTVGGVSNKIRQGSMAFWFPLTHAQLDLLTEGKVPRDLRYDFFSSFLDWL